MNFTGYAIFGLEVDNTRRLPRNPDAFSRFDQLILIRAGVAKELSYKRPTGTFVPVNLYICRFDFSAPFARAAR